jgi:hypothetical protein
MVFSLSVIKVIIDFTVTTLPISLILKMRMRESQKISVILLLACGYSITVTSAIKTYFLYVTYFQSYDTWIANDTYLTGSIENHLSLVGRDSGAHSLNFRCVLAYHVRGSYWRTCGANLCC